MRCDVSDHILTINAGSSSLKFALFAVDELSCVAIGQIEGLGGDPNLTLKDGSGEKILERCAGRASGSSADHAGGLRTILAVIAERFPRANIAAVGHRVVHGGLEFAAPVRVDEGVLQRLKGLVPLAPLHQPHNVSGIEAAGAAFPGVPQIACFDTAFHRAHPFVNDAFALPRSALR